MINFIMSVTLTLPSTPFANLQNSLYDEILLTLQYFGCLIRFQYSNTSPFSSSTTPKLHLQDVLGLTALALGWWWVCCNLPSSLSLSMVVWSFDFDWWIINGYDLTINLLVVLLVFGFEQVEFTLVDDPCSFSLTLSSMGILMSFSYFCLFLYLFHWIWLLFEWLFLCLSPGVWKVCLFLEDLRTIWYF